MSLLPIAVLSGTAATALGGALLLLKRARREAAMMRSRALGRPTDEDEAEGQDATLVGTARRLGEAVSKRGTSRGLKQKLAMAGYHSSSAPTVYVGTKMMLLALGVGCFSLLLAPLGFELATKLLLIAGGSAVMFFVPNMLVEIKRGQRCDEVRRCLPDSIDMMDICVSSGMGLDTAWNAVADEFREVSPTYADEMELTNLEISLGVTRTEAMKHMADRTGADDLSSLVALLVQSERFGAGIVDALRTFAKTMRETRGQRAAEEAEKTSIKLLFPMVMFIFPALLIVMIGPAVIQLAGVMFAD
jgi:tight adherence protein C